MAEVRVKDLAQQLNIREDVLLQNIKNAGLPQTNGDDLITDVDKKVLLRAMMATKTGGAIAGRRAVVVTPSATSAGGAKVEVKVATSKTYIERLEEKEAAEREAIDRQLAEEERLKREQEEAKRAAASQKANKKTKKTTKVNNENNGEIVSEATINDKTVNERGAVNEKMAEVPATDLNADSVTIADTKVNAAESQSVTSPEKKVAEKKTATSLSGKKSETAGVSKTVTQSAEEQKKNEKHASHKGHHKVTLSDKVIPADETVTTPPHTGKNKKASKKARTNDDRWDDLPLEEIALTHLEDNDVEFTPVIRTVTSSAEVSRILEKPLAQVNNQHGFKHPTALNHQKIELEGAISVSDLAQRLNIKSGALIKQLMKLGVMANINQVLDRDTAELVIAELGHLAVIVENDWEKKIFSEENLTGKIAKRPPIVTVMGHVDHGKTSLLDYIRKSKVAEGEAGGITQHIGAYHIEVKGGIITFLDTPGHAAFTSMRARGAQATDVAVLVVASDDGVMPQTKEAIQHAKEAGVPIVVALTKIDKPDVAKNVDQIKTELAALEVVSEDWGGDVPIIGVSAKTGQGVDDLLEAILLQAELLDLQASHTMNPRGIIIEAHLDKSLGTVATALVMNGTLERGQTLVIGGQIARVRLLSNEQGHPIHKAGPSIPVRIFGCDELPVAGDKFVLMTNAKEAEAYIEQRKAKKLLEKSLNMNNNDAPRSAQDVLMQMQGNVPSQLNIIIKTDVHGTLEAIVKSLMDIKHDEVKVKVVSSGIGAITETDAVLAAASKAILIGFNVRADKTAKDLVEQHKIDMRYYSVIYQLIDDVKSQMSGLLKPQYQEKILGLAEVRDVFNSPKFGQIAGCMVTDGLLSRMKKIRVLRSNQVIFEGELESLRRFKDDVKEVRMGSECGIGVKNYTDVRVGDQIEVFDSIEIKRTID